MKGNFQDRKSSNNSFERDEFNEGRGTIHIHYEYEYEILPSLLRNINLLKTKHNVLYIRNQSVPRCKHFPPWL